MIVPLKRPQQSREKSEAQLEDAGVDLTRPALLAVRGYYRHTMGNPSRNDRGLYDDAMFLVTPAYYGSFNANTDPSVARKGIAVLKVGLWSYQRGIHRGRLSRPYQALVQAADVTVLRDGTPPRPDTGRFGINIHSGGLAATWSEGCLTIYQAQWQEFIGLVYGEMERYAQNIIPLLLREAE